MSKNNVHLSKSRSFTQKLLRTLIVMSVIIIFFMISASTAIYIHYNVVIKRPVLNEGQSATIDIPPNTSWPQVVSILQQNNLVPYKWYFEYWGRTTGLVNTVRAGRYEVQGPMSLDELSEVLRRGGRAEEMIVTFPEGLNVFLLADRFSELGIAERDHALSMLRSEELLAKYGIPADSFEGYLFPETYRFPKDADLEYIIDRMHQQWQSVWSELERDYSEQIQAIQNQYGFDTHQIITLASLIERETGSAKERDIIARVFYNRLDRNMPLQTDPTCVYGEDIYLKIPTRSLCRDATSLYSTYVIAGLPPGPIANPGKASLEATLNPSLAPEAMDYLYFVSRRDGSQTHYFSKSYDEHRRAIRRFLKTPNRK